MASQPGDGPEVEAQPISPALLAGVGDELEAGVHIQSAPLVVGQAIAVEVNHLLPGEGFVVSDVLEIHLDDLEGFGGVPVHEGAGAARLTEGSGETEMVLVVVEDMADGGPGEVQLLILRQLELKAFGSQSGLVPGRYHPLLDLRRGLRAVVEVALVLLGEDVIDDRSGDTKGSGGVGDVMARGGEIFQDGTACGHGVDGHPRKPSGFLGTPVDASQGLVVNKGARLHIVSSPGPLLASPAA